MSIIGHKGQDSAETRLDFVAFWSWNLDVVVFQSWNLNLVAFCPLKKCLGIAMMWFNCLHFSMPRCFRPRISMPQFFGLGISMLWYNGRQGLVFVSLWKQKNSHKIISTILLKDMSMILIYATVICLMYAKAK